MSDIVHCAFCDRKGLEAKEDFIPSWAGRVLRSIYGPRLDIVYSTRQLDTDGTTVLQHDHVRRQTYSAVELSGVCETCNNKWMSRIEREVKPILEPMIRDIRAGVSPHQLEPLARWMTLKALEADLIPHGYPTAGPEDYHAFFSNQQPMPGLRVDLGRIDLRGKPDLYYSISPMTAAQALGGLSMRDPVALELSFSMGALWVQTLFIPTAARTYPELPTRPVTPHWTTVWPSSGEANWPPPYSFTSDQLPTSLSSFPEAEAWIAEHVRKEKKD